MPALFDKEMYIRAKLGKIKMYDWEDFGTKTPESFISQITLNNKIKPTVKIIVFEEISIFCGCISLIITDYFVIIGREDLAPTRLTFG